MSQTTPTRDEAHRLLAWASAQNPGAWTAHCKTAARAAETIANACGLCAEKAYVLGLLHDIGRYEGVRALHHVYAGHALLAERGYPDAARICLTHSFPVQRLSAFSGKNDCTLEETAWLETALASVVYDEYDRLIQLCDGIATAEGVSLMDVRLLDVMRRHGVNAESMAKVEAFFALRDHFSRLCGVNIYRLFAQEIQDGLFL